MRKIKSQLGRSMVEMLGVLAIIGVLSIGGVTGYRYAMRQIAYIQISDFIDQLFLFLLKEYINQRKPLICIVITLTIAVISFLMKHAVILIKNFVRIMEQKHLIMGAISLTMGKKAICISVGKSFKVLPIMPNFWGQMVELDLWTSSPEMCKFVLNKINGNDDYVSIIKGYYRVWVGRTNGKYPDLRGYNTLTDSDIEKICSPYSTAYAGRYSIPIGIGIHTEIYRCTN